MAENAGGGGANLGGINYEVSATTDAAKQALRSFRAESSDTAKAIEQDAQRAQQALQGIGRNIAQQAAGAGRSQSDAQRATERALGLPAGALGGGGSGGRGAGGGGTGGAAGQPAEPGYTGPSLAFETLQRAGRDELNPQDASRLYQARRQQERIAERSRSQAAREAAVAQAAQARLAQANRQAEAQEQARRVLANPADTGGALEDPDVQKAVRQQLASESLQKRIAQRADEQDPIQQAARAAAERDRDLEKRFGPGIRASVDARRRIRVQAQRDDARDAADRQKEADQRIKEEGTARERGLRLSGIETRDPVDGGGGSGGAGGGGGEGEEHGGISRSNLATAIRFGGAVAGIPIALSIAASAGRLLHSALEAGVAAAERQERLSRQIAANYGASTAAVTRGAGSLGALGTSGTSQAQALAGAGGLATTSGLAPTQITALLQRTQDFASITGNNFDQAFRDKVIGAISGGGDALAGYGVRLDDAYTKTQAFGGALASTFDTMTDGQRQQARLNSFLDQTANYQGVAAASAKSMVSAQDQLASSTERLAAAIGNMAGPKAAEGIANFATFIGLLVPASGGDGEGFAGGGTKDPATPKGARLKIQVDPRTGRPAVGPGGNKPEDLAAFQNFLSNLPGLPQGSQGGAYAPQLVGARIPYLADILGHLDEVAGRAADRLSRLQGIIGDLATASPASVRGSANEQAAQALIARNQAIQGGLGPSGLRRQLEVGFQQSKDTPERYAILDQLRQLSELEGAYQRLGAAQQAQAQARSASAAANRDLQEFQIGQQGRQLDVAVQQSTIRTQALTLEGQMAPLLLQQADLQDRIRVAQRDSLTLRRQESTAARDVLGASSAVQGIEYQRQRLLLQAQIRRSLEIQGKPVGDLPDPADVFEQARQLSHDILPAQLNELDANRRQQLISQQAQGQALDRGDVLTNLESEQRALEDRLQPIQAAARSEKDLADQIQRALDIAAAGDEPERVRLQQRVNEIQLLNNEADRAVQWATEYAQQLSNAATAAAFIRDNLPRTDLPATGESANPDRPYARPAGSGGIALNANVVISGDFGSVDALTDSILGKLRPFIRDQITASARAAAGGNAAQSGLVGVTP